MVVLMRSETKLWFYECGQRQGYGCVDDVRDKRPVFITEARIVV
jgi:hypothetical protein